MGTKRIYKALLHCYPAAFRQEYGNQMLLMFTEQLSEARRSGGRLRQAALWIRAAFDALTVSPKEHGHVMMQDLRSAIRSAIASPTFAMVAILSLALGIGANTAIFSLWNGLLHASLPAVQNPSELMILTNPERIGSWNGMLNGERTWLSFPEFEELRNRADIFSAMMAVQSYREDWQVRSADGDWEVAQGRLVSDGFFDVLGVRPALGRMFADTGSLNRSPTAVIGYGYWQRKFGGLPDVIGKTIALRHVTLTVIGVAPSGFIGETAGEQPDLWVPLGVQPAMRPGEDSLHDVSPTKNMWLHVFGRLKPGATPAQAEAQSNAIFQANLASFYGAVSAENHEALNQYLKIRPAGRGVSAARRAFSDSLTALLAAVGLLLLIACANLANLLLARGATRKPEIALRLSLGASRGRIVRQLVTESLFLAVVGGVAGLATAYVLHGALARMMAESDPNFRMSFALDPIVLGFAFAVTAAAAILFGVLPAWQSTGIGAGDGLKEQSRHATGSRSRARWGRVLVSLQLALSLPLLVGAGLLARTLYNLQHVDLGYRTELLAIAHVDTDAAGFDAAHSNRYYHDLRERLQRIPSVEAATYSALGLFSHYSMSLPIEVEGRPPNGNTGRGSAMELVGPGYFSTLGEPMLRGRELLESDDAGAPKVCVVNETFARLFFGARNPVGMHVTTIAHQARTTYSIVGVAKDARIQSLKGGAAPRFFLPWTQAPTDPKAPFLVLRAKRDAQSIVEPVRHVIQQADPSLSVSYVRTLDEQLAPFTAQDRSTALLAEAFAGSALLLAAIGLYGVLSYGVVRRRSEIAIRVALGAQASRVIAAILKETAGLVAVGLVLGAGLAYAGSRTIENRLFGVAPQDPGTLALAVGLLIAVALSAAYLPARRAASLDPMTALRQE
jgi:predicted permease